MEVNRLLGDEISYELEIRGLTVLRAVAENRSTLRGALRAEREGMCSSLTSERELVPQQELVICQQKLVNIGGEIRNLDVQNRENEYRRLSTRLCHISQRLRRLPPGTETEKEKRRALLVECMQLIDSLATVYDNPTMAEENQVSVSFEQSTNREGSILDDPNPLLPEVQIPTATIRENSIRVDYGDMPRSAIARDVSTGTDLLPPTRDLIDLGRQRSIRNDPSKRLTQDKNDRTSVRFVDNVQDQAMPLHQQIVSELDMGSSSMREIRPDPVENIYFFPKSRDDRKPSTKVTQDFENILKDLRLSPVCNPISYSSGEHHRFADVARWNLRYDGETSVTNFLERVEELRQSRGVNHDQLLRSAPELFKGQALLWYRVQKFDSWKELKDKLKEDFQPYDYIPSLWEEIRKRTQGARERVVTYVSAMENLFNKLAVEKPPEATRLNYIRRNLLPYIQSQLVLITIHSIPELTRLAKSVEESAQRAQQFCPPPVNYKYLLEPELAYHKPSGSVGSPASVAAFEMVESTQNRQTSTPPSELNLSAMTTAVSPATSSVVLCWNCKKTGHRFRKCTERRRTFCFKCGRDSVYVKDCPDCQKNRRGGQ